LPWGKVGAEFVGGVFVDVGFQLLYDVVAHPDWTWQQYGQNAVAQIPGSLVATGAGLLARGVVNLAAAHFFAPLGAIAGPAGIAVGFAVAVWLETR
jgi:hypothetical protein